MKKFVSPWIMIVVLMMQIIFGFACIKCFELEEREADVEVAYEYDNDTITFHTSEECMVEFYSIWDGEGKRALEVNSKIPVNGTTNYTLSIDAQLESARVAYVEIQKVTELKPTLATEITYWGLKISFLMAILICVINVIVGVNLLSKEKTVSKN